MTVEAARQCAKEWRALVHMQLNEFHTAIFAWPCVLSDCPPVLWWLSLGEGQNAVVINREKSATTENQGADVKYVGYGVYVDDCVCYLA